MMCFLLKSLSKVVFAKALLGGNCKSFMETVRLFFFFGFFSHNLFLVFANTVKPQ